jgi:hypothetical protein
MPDAWPSSFPAVLVGSSALVERTCEIKTLFWEYYADASTSVRKLRSKLNRFDVPKSQETLIVVSIPW